MNRRTKLSPYWKKHCLDHTDARVLMELDQLYKRLNRPHIERSVLSGTAHRYRNDP